MSVEKYGLLFFRSMDRMRTEMDIRNKKDNRLLKNLKLSQRRHYATSLVTIVLGDFKNPAI